MMPGPITDPVKNHRDRISDRFFPSSWHQQYTGLYDDKCLGRMVQGKKRGGFTLVRFC